MRRKALLAIMFAGGMLESQQPGLSEGNTVKSPAEQKSVVCQIIERRTASAMVKAYELLKTASAYMTQNPAHPDSLYLASLDRMAQRGLRGPHADDLWVRWANDVSLKKFLDDRQPSNDMESKVSIKPCPTSGGIIEAGEALQAALPYISQTTDKFARCNMYFIALRMSMKLGDVTTSKTCRYALSDAFRNCVQRETTDESEIEGVVSVLNSIAYGRLPILIPNDNPADIKWPAQMPDTPGNWSDDAADESERLQLRALKIADMLDAKNHIRRKSHRDLALWYALLGQTEKAEREKQILFGLVGVTDDKILYPVSVGCGNYVWWTLHPEVFGVECGMG